MIHGRAHEQFAEYAGGLAKRGRILAGGNQLKEGTGKAIGSAYYLPLYMREQSQSAVD